MNFKSKNKNNFFLPTKLKHKKKENAINFNS